MVYLAFALLLAFLSIISYRIVVLVVYLLRLYFLVFYLVCVCFFPLRLSGDKKKRYLHGLKCAFVNVNTYSITFRVAAFLSRLLNLKLLQQEKAKAKRNAKKSWTKLTKRGVRRTHIVGRCVMKKKTSAEQITTRTAKKCKSTAMERERERERIRSCTHDGSKRRIRLHERKMWWHFKVPEDMCLVFIVI